MPLHFNRSTATLPLQRRARRAAFAGMGLLVTLLAGCDSIFEVENPNNIKGEDLALPQSQAALTNGAFGTVARQIAASIGLSSPVTDEITFIGSRDAWRQLDTGFLNDTQNEFLNVAFPVIAQGRWMADEAIRGLEGFRQAGTLRNENDLARAYIFGAVSYINIADTFDDFALSNRGEAAAPVGEQNMQKLYDTAIQYLTKSLEIANRTNNAELRLRSLALRSRAHFAKALWAKLNPAGQRPSNPLVSSAQAAEDARAFFALNPDPVWRYAINLGTNDMIPGGEITLGHNMNSRAELQFGRQYVSTVANDPAKITAVVLMDPINNVPDPFVAAQIDAFKKSFIYLTHTIVSTRELRLILAEHALANGNTAEAVQQINMVRAMDNLTAYNPSTHQITPTQILQHQRRSSLFLQNKRLADMYRFGVQAPEWAQTSDAVTRPGTFFPIANVERLSNCHIAGTC